MPSQQADGVLAGQRYRTSSPVKADEHALDFRGALEYGEDVRRSHRRLGHMFVIMRTTWRSAAGR